MSAIMANKIENRDPDFSYVGEVIAFYNGQIPGRLNEKFEFLVTCVKYKDDENWRANLYCYLNGAKISCTRMNLLDAPLLFSSHDIINSHIMDITLKD